MSVVHFFDITWQLFNKCINYVKDWKEAFRLPSNAFSIKLLLLYDVKTFKWRWIKQQEAGKETIIYQRIQSSDWLILAEIIKVYWEDLIHQWNESKFKISW